MNKQKELREKLRYIDIDINDVTSRFLSDKDVDKIFKTIARYLPEETNIFIEKYSYNFGWNNYRDETLELLGQTENNGEEKSTRPVLIEEKASDGKKDKHALPEKLDPMAFDPLDVVSLDDPDMIYRVFSYEDGMKIIENQNKILEYLEKMGE